MSQTKATTNRESLELEPWEGTLVPEQVFPPLPDLIKQEQFALALEERTQVLKAYYDLICVGADTARKICNDHGGTNRLYIRVDRWGFNSVERTPRIRRVEGQLLIENPDFVKQGWN